MKDYEESPPRLVETEDALAPLLRADVVRSSASEEVRAWEALEQRLRRSRRDHRLMRTVVAVSAATALVCGWFAFARLHPSTPPPVTPAAVEPAPAPDVLPPGRSRLADGSHITLSEAGVARVNSVKGQETRVELQQGRVGVDVVRQLPGNRFVVETSGYEFRVVGTRFTVTTSQARPRLEVQEGTVEVWRKRQRLARVVAGARWPESTPPEPMPSTTVSTPPRETTSNCLTMTRAGNSVGGEACLARRARSGGVDAELALYELARLRQNVRGNSTGAIAALREYQRRFPRGAFRSEVQLTLIELLGATGRSAEAAAEASAALRAGVAPERAAELHLVVASSLVARGDCAAAEPHFAAAARVAGHRVAELRRQCAAAEPSPTLGPESD